MSTAVPDSTEMDTTVELLRSTQQHALDYLHSLKDRPVHARGSHEELLELLGGSLTVEGEHPGEVIRRLAAAGEAGAVASAGPRYFGYVIGGSLPAALAADWLTSAWDQNCGLYSTSPLASVAEEVVRPWLLDLLALPPESGVGFVTGCQMANFTALASARHSVLRAAGWDVEAKGLYGAPSVTIVLSDEAHVTIHTSLRMLGFGQSSAVRVETDGQGRMRADALRAAIESVDGPLIVCAQAGNVNTGAFDPLREIAEVVKARGGWLHVDGAFGLWAAASPEKRALLDGHDLADSWATDAHKWLNVPYDCGIVIVRDPSAMAGAMGVKAAYLIQTEGAERDPVDWVPEFSRRARGITVWAALRSLGRQGVAGLVEQGCAQAQLFAELLGGVEGIEILNDVTLNQVLVRFGDDDRKTAEMVRRVQDDGTCWLSGTTWHGMGAMRISVSGWMTTEEDVRKSAAAIVRLWRM